MMHHSGRSILLCAVHLLVLGVAEGQILTHGPVVGGVTASNANVFIRTNQQAEVVVRYGTDPNLTNYLETPSATTEVGNDFTKIISLSALLPETTYYLNVVVNGSPNRTAPPYPHFKSFAPGSVARDFKFVVLTDFLSVETLRKPSVTFANASAEFPDFVFIGGDFDHRGPRRIEEKRNMFKELYDRTTPFMSDFVPLILEETAIVHQWDDHDAGPNNLDRTYVDWDLSQQVFQEYVPSYPLPLVSPGIWQKFTYAQAECFVLDCRSQRDPELDPDGAGKSMLDGNSLGAAGQLEWLKNALLTSKARWKIIFTSVITNPTTKTEDAWGAYQTEWNELKDFITSSKIDGVVFISGDLHLGAIDNGIASGFPEMCVPTPNSQKEPGERCSTADEGIWSEGYYEDPCPGYGVVTVLTEPDRLVFQAVDQTGVTRVSYTVASATQTPPVITAQPKNKSVPVGATARFRVVATGSTPLRYQWKENGLDIPGATRASYITPPVTEGDNGDIFSVVVTNSAGTITSGNARLTVKLASREPSKIKTRATK